MYITTILFNLLVVGLVVVVLLNSREQYRERAFVTVESLSAVLERNLVVLLEKADLALLAVTEDLQRQTAGGDGLDAARIDALLAGTLQRLPESLGFRVTDAGGRIVYAGGKSRPVGSDISDRAYFRRLRDDPKAGLVVSEPIRGQISNRWIVLIARRLEGADGSFRGIVFASLAVTQLERQFSSIDIGLNGAVVMFSRSLNVVARNPEFVAGDSTIGSRALTPQVTALIESDQMAGRYEAKSRLDGIKRTYYFRRVGDFPWYLCVGMADQDYLAAWWREIIVLGSLAGLACTASLTAAAIAGRRWRALQSSEERYRALFRHMQVGFSLLEMVADTFGRPSDYRLLAYNRAFLSIFGLRPKVREGSLLSEVFPQPSRDMMDRLMIYGEVALTGHSVHFEAFSSDAGKWIDIIAYCPAPMQVAVLVEDITRQKADRERQRLAASVFAASQEGIVITGTDQLIVEANPSCCAMTGFSSAELAGQPMSALSSGRQDDAFYPAIFGAVAEHGHWRGEVWNRRKNGEVFPQWLTVSAVRDDSGRTINYVCNFIDISQVKESEARLEHLAHHDPLTGLPNRLMLMSRLQHAVDRSNRDGTIGAVLFLDLDQFKNINDSMGHLIGDDLLRQVSQRYAHRVRESDTLARMGGDEFIVLLENLHEPEHAAAVAQSLTESLREPFLLPGGQDVFITTSVGISVFPTDSDDADQLIGKADAAMYQAKNGGRDTFRFYTKAMTQAANLRVELEASLRRGIERQEFLLHYQPLVAIESGRVTGVEALVRWQRPGHGLVPPGQFIPLAEETGLIVPLGSQVLRAACRQMREWLDAGYGLDTIAVNLSAHQLKRPDIHLLVREVLEESGLDPKHLELEITESALMDSRDEAEDRLCALKSLGVGLAIDDFGTGYSSLSYLKRFPIDKLKVDQSFVRDIPHDAADMEIVGAVVGLAKNLNLDVVAEGIETEEQLAFLRQLNCRAGQGYLFSRPLQAADLEEYLSMRALAIG